MSLATTYTYTKGELRQINMCRIYLRVISVSDITDFDGTRITKSSYYGTRDDTHPTTWWPNQQRPTKRGWCVWQRFLLSISDHNCYLLQTLGNWLDISKWHHQGKLLIDADNRTLLHKSGNQWFAHQRQGRHSSQYSLDKTLINATTNPHFKVQVKSHRSSLECTAMIVIVPKNARTLHFT
jgi:hypothetical protein